MEFLFFFVVVFYLILVYPPPPPRCPGLENGYNSGVSGKNYVRVPLIVLRLLLTASSLLAASALAFSSASASSRVCRPSTSRCQDGGRSSTESPSTCSERVSNVRVCFFFSGARVAYIAVITHRPAPPPNAKTLMADGNNITTNDNSNNNNSHDSNNEHRQQQTPPARI